MWPSESVFKTSDNNRLSDPEEGKSKQQAQTKLTHTSHCLPITVAPKRMKEKHFLLFFKQSVALKQE